MTESLRTVDLPANRLTVPLVGDEMIVVRQADWRRIRARLVRLKSSPSWLSNASWAILGIATSSFVAWLVWLPNEAALAEESRLAFGFLNPLLMILSGAALVVGIVCLVLDKIVARHTRVTAAEVIAEMDEVHLAPEVQPTSESVPVAVPADIPAVEVPSKLDDELPKVDDKTRLAPWTNLLDAPGSGPRDNGRLGDFLQPGDRLRHSDFGLGRVIALSGEGRKRVAEVHFDYAGRKRLLIVISPIEMVV